jgi:hypothetical protein
VHGERISKESAETGENEAGRRATPASTDTGDVRSPLGVQTKLTVGAVDSPLEREADQVARRVVQAIRSRSVLAEPHADGETDAEGRVHRSMNTSDASTTEPVTRRIQRRTTIDASTTEPVTGRIQRRPTIDAEGADVDADTDAAIRSQRGGGQALSRQARTTMESAFGADFGQVRVHTGARAAQLNRSLQAEAFTTGSDIFFRSGAPDTTSRSGQELLAHELTHVVQQTGTTAPRAKGGVSESRSMRPGPNTRVDGSDPAKIAALLAEAEAEEALEERELAANASKARAKRRTARRPPRRKQGADNTNFRGGAKGLLARAAYGVKRAVKNLPDVAVNRQVPAGPNGTAHIDPTDYGICDTETPGENDIRVEAVRDGDEWHLELKKVSAKYSKIIQLPAGVSNVTGPGGGGPGETTLANSRMQIKNLLATFGPPYYMLDAVDGHESVHEERLLPALRKIAPAIQQEFVNISVPYEGDGLKLAAQNVSPGGPQAFGDKAAALAAMKAKPEYAAAVANILAEWDVAYDDLIDNDHQGKAQKGEEKHSKPMIKKINAFRKQNGRKAIPIKYTWTPY